MEAIYASGLTRSRSFKQKKLIQSILYTELIKELLGGTFHRKNLLQISDSKPLIGCMGKFIQQILIQGTFRNHVMQTKYVTGHLQS